MKNIIDLTAYPVKDMLQYLIKDKTTGENIIFATDTYGDDNNPIFPTDQITLDFLKMIDLQPRVCKSRDEQNERTRAKAEVFTPSWIVNKMNNHLDAEWFGKENVFNEETDQGWKTNPEPIAFDNEKTWQDYVLSRRLEITCGEAPYLVTRYDAATGEVIDVADRMGLLDRKIRVINENVNDEAKWLEWVKTAYKSIFGYEYQGDNLLIARINLLQTFVDYMQSKWNRNPDKEELRSITKIILWNIWQMDGLKGTIPFREPYEEETQITFGFFGIEEEEKQENYNCRIYSWTGNKSFEFNDLKEGRKMKFDYVIGNPPYQDNSAGDKLADDSIYHLFMDAAYEISEKVELITPARFLFDNGNTPTKWNKKMLNDEHFKVLNYVENAKDVFSNVGFKGGVAIHFRDKEKRFGAIECFTNYPELNSILNKVKNSQFTSLTTIINNQNHFNLVNLYSDYPELKAVISSDGREKRLTSGCTDYDCFHNQEYANDIYILGYSNGKRVDKYISTKYLDMSEEVIKKYKVVIPANNGSGALGETISSPVILNPNSGYTQTFISIGLCDSKEEAERILKYLKCKFSRTMLSVLKVTQNGKKPVWKYVPLQDFTNNSDIDWSKSVADIDKQLYAKYGLTDEEIAFIESHIKEMA